MSGKTEPPANMPTAAFAHGSGASPPTPYDGPPRIPGYELLEEIGRGGMGVVFKARQLALNRLVAVKMMLAGQYAVAANLARFLSEAESVAQLSHPNIVQIYEIGQVGRQPFLALEYVSGGALAKKLRPGPLPAGEAAALVETLARAVHHAHAHGIIHRDLKPANVLLGEDGSPRIVDFGVAKRVSGEVGLTETGAIMGTPSYMAPEQAAGSGKVTALADVYSLGAILYECLTGRPPFQAPTAMETVLQVLRQEPVPPRHLQPGLPPDLQTICLKCLHKDPTRRYASAEDLADDLHRFLNRQAILARPVGPFERGWLWCRRNPAAAAAAGLAALVLAALIVVPVLIAVREAENARVIDGERQKALNALRESRRQAAATTLERALALCESGEVSRGLLHLARGQELARQAEDAGLERACRLNFASWLREVHSLSAVLPHPDKVNGVALTQDGKTVATACADGKLRLWRLETGRLLSDPIPHPGPLLAVAVSPGGVAVTGCGDGVARQWDIVTGKRIGPDMVHYIPAEPEKAWPIHPGVYSVAYSPDGSLIATGGRDGAARLWKSKDGDPAGPPLKHPPSSTGVFAVAFNHDGRSLATGGSDWEAYIWDTRSGKKMVAVPQRAAILSVAFSPDGTRLTAGSLQSNRAYQWNTRSGASAGPSLKHLGSVKALAYHPSGRLLLAGGDEQAARLWDPLTGTQVGPPLPHRGGIEGAAVSRDGRALVTAGADGDVKVWRRARGSLVHSLPQPQAVRSVAFTPDGRHLLAGSQAGEVRTFDAATGRAVAPGLASVVDGQKWVTGIAVSPDGKHAFAAYCQHQVVRRFDRATGEEIGKTGEHGDEVWGMALSPDGRTILTGAIGYKPAPAGSSARLWDASTGKPFGRVMKHGNSVYAIAFRPDGKAVLTGSVDATTRLWDAATGEPLGEPRKHPGEVWAVAYRHDGKAVLAGGGDRNAQIFDAETWEPLGVSMQHQAGIWAVAFSPDGRLALTASADQTARVWDAETGHPVGPPLRHAREVRALAVSRDGRLLVTGGDDALAKLWAMPAAGPEDPEQAMLWIEALSGLTMDARGKINVLTHAEWRERRARCQGSSPTDAGPP